MLMAPVVCGFSPKYNTIFMHENTGKGSRFVANVYLLVISGSKDPHTDICGLTAVVLAYIPNY